VAAPTKQSKLREVLRNDHVKTVILIVIVIGSVLFFWFGVRVVLATEHPFMTVATGSMIPTLNVGDLIVVQGYADPSTIYAKPYPNGDILVFLHWSSSEGTIHLVHRAVGEKTVGDKRYLITLGDNNRGATDKHFNLTTHAELLGLPEEYVVGKVIAHVPLLGQIALFMQTLEGRIIIIALVVALLIVEFIPFPKKEKAKVSKQE